MMICSHTAVLVRSVRKAKEFLEAMGFEGGPEEEFAGEGTREVYFGRDFQNSLLLVEPLQEGPYRRAMLKRGPGLHHLAVDTESLAITLPLLQGAGWVLHKVSDVSIPKTKTAWLYGNNIPALLELQERKSLESAPSFVSEIGLSDFDAKLAAVVGFPLKKTSDPYLSIQGQTIFLRELL